MPLQVPQVRHGKTGDKASWRGFIGVEYGHEIVEDHWSTMEQMAERWRKCVSVQGNAKIELKSDD